MRRLLVLVVLALLVPLATTFSCTTFDGLGYDAGATAPVNDAASDDASPAPPKGYLSVEDAAHVCSLAMVHPSLEASISASIGVPLQIGMPHFSTCISWLSRGVTATRKGFAVQQQMLKNVRNAPDIGAAAQACFVNVSLGDPCDAGSCFNGFVVACASGNRVIVQCKPPQELDQSACTSGPGGPQCVRAATPCSTQIVCDGDIEHHCAPGSTTTELGSDCSRTGQSCVAGEGCLSPGDTYVCPAGANGSGEIITDCNGAVARVCVPLQPRVDIDCAQAGLTCLAQGTTAVCASPSDTCTPLSAGIDTCIDDQRVTACVDGRPTTIDCTTIGYAKCVAAPTAHCE
ncbi:MAG TPA: hypothetical protein VIF62_33325 [Labilithrix sp.]